MAILRDFPYNNALFGLVSYNNPCSVLLWKAKMVRMGYLLASKDAEEFGGACCQGPSD